MAITKKLLLLVALLTSQVLSWGEHGHRTVGYLAQMYFTPEAEHLFNELIIPNAAFDISDGAVWADNFSVQNKYPWSKPLHFIDANDNAPEKCAVHFHEDCDKYESCIVAAISNFVGTFDLVRSLCCLC